MFTFDPLWKTLLNKGITKTQLREMTGISTATLSKLSKDEYVSMQVLDNICGVLQVRSVTEVIEFINTINTTLDDIEQTMERLADSKYSSMDANNRDIFLLYLTMEEFIINKMKDETQGNNDRFLQLCYVCFKEKLLPEDLLDALNDLLKKQLFN